MSTMYDIDKDFITLYITYRPEIPLAFKELKLIFVIRNKARTQT